jgi:hypothetical protein
VRGREAHRAPSGPPAARASAGRSTPRQLPGLRARSTGSPPRSPVTLTRARRGQDERDPRCAIDSRDRLLSNAFAATVQSAQAHRADAMLDRPCWPSARDRLGYAMPTSDGLRLQITRVLDTASRMCAPGRPLARDPNVVRGAPITEDAALAESPPPAAPAGRSSPTR